MAIQSALTTVSTQNLSIASLFGVVGKVAVVTGASSGLGSYAAMTLALNGARVYIVARREDKLMNLIKDLGRRSGESNAPVTAKQGSMHYIVGDLGHKEGIKAVVDAVAQKESHLDILVNNVGVHLFPASYPVTEDPVQRAQALWDVEWSQWQETLDLNTIASYYVSVGFAPLLSAAPRNGPGNPGPVIIVNTSSAATLNSGDLPLHYAASKAAAEKISKLLAGNFKTLGIRVNSIACGLFPSEMTTEGPAGAMFGEGSPFSKLVATNLVPRIGTVEDFAGTVLYLGSMAGAYLNGITILTDGGMSQIWGANTRLS